jgi:DnaJ-class molecular chaperone
MRLEPDHYDDLGWPRSVLGKVELEGFEAAHGVSRAVEVADEDPCGACGGSGAEPGTSAELCRTCLGKGTVRASVGLIGRWLKVEPCPACEGQGVFQPPCPACAGSGALRRARTIRVRIPAGVEDGTRLRVAGEGESSYLVVRVKPVPRDSLAIRLLALALLACAVGLLVYLLVWA